MDTFMDKLAQKLTAQEMIKANTAAETEELNSLREQLAEYNACLEKFRRLVEEGAEKLQGSWATGTGESDAGESRAEISGEISRLVEECLQKIQAVQQDTEGLEALGKRLEDTVKGAMETELKDRLAEELGAQVEGALSRQLESQVEGVLSRQLESQVEGVLSRQLEGKVENALRSQLHSQFESTLKSQLESAMKSQLQSQVDSALRRQLPGQLESEFQKLLEAQAEAIESSLGGKNTDVSDSVHKECVKVYRNVQAVVVEEGEKQKTITTGMAEDVKAVNGKMGAILGVSVAALIFSLASAALQILNVLNVKLF